MLMHISFFSLKKKKISNMDKKINIWKVLKMNRIRWDVDMENNIIYFFNKNIFKIIEKYFFK